MSDTNDNNKKRTPNEIAGRAVSAGRLQMLSDMSNEEIRDRIAEEIKEFSQREGTEQAVQILTDHIKKREKRIERLKLSSNPAKWKEAATDRLVLIGLIEAKHLISRNL